MNDEQFTCFWEKDSEERVINVIIKGGKNFFLPAPYSKEGASLEKFAE